MNRSQRRSLSKSKNPTDLASLAERHRMGGRLGQAEEKYREAIALHPGYVEAHNNLGSLLQATGRVVEATSHFVHAFRINPKDATVVFNLGVALAAQHLFKEAVVLYREALALNPSLADAQSGLAYSLTQLAQYDEAEHHYLEALKINPLNWQARVDLGLALLDQGKIVEAFAQAEILSRAETAPDFPHKNFGILLARAGCPDGARLCFENHLARAPADADDIAMLLASVGGALPERASDRQIAQLYTARASRWDVGAAGQTGYQGHRLVAAALDELGAISVESIVDAGCGTGLVGELVRAKAHHLVGIDMSDAMLAQARQKNVYDALICGDLLDYLTSHEQSCDIITSAATLIHFGDLDPVFAAAAQCLRGGGLFAFTLFPNDDDPEAVAIGTLNGLAQGGCFRHGDGYLKRTAAGHGFSVALLRREAHEFVRNVPLPGTIAVLRRDG
jgi:predicted TPR repeat methyltransferase/cytochrome c-type biogenesis protein CcmH/NrfG